MILLVSSRTNIKKMRGSEDNGKINVRKEEMKHYSLETRVGCEIESVYVRQNVNIPCLSKVTKAKVLYSLCCPEAFLSGFTSYVHKTMQVPAHIKRGINSVYISRLGLYFMVNISTVTISVGLHYLVSSYYFS